MNDGRLASTALLICIGTFHGLVGETLHCGGVSEGKSFCCFDLGMRAVACIQASVIDQVEETDVFDCHRKNLQFALALLTLSRRHDLRMEGLRKTSNIGQKFFE